MGYNTDFSGSFKITPAPDETISDYVNAFSSMRHMARDIDVVKRIDPEWEEHCLNGELGDEAAFYVPTWTRYSPEKRDESVLDNGNRPPKGVPGLWCQWVVEGNKLTWDQGEKFYNYVEWLEFLMKNMFEPAGYAIEGSVDFRGDEFEDVGTITVSDGKVSVKYWN